jgi:hypothetical protein
MPLPRRPDRAAAPGTAVLEAEHERHEEFQQAEDHERYQDECGGYRRRVLDVKVRMMRDEPPFSSTRGE